MDTPPCFFSPPVLQRETTVAALSKYGVLTLLHSKRPKLHTILAFLSAVGLKGKNLLIKEQMFFYMSGRH